jgi:SpoU rRNA methylase family enzyme
MPVLFNINVDLMLYPGILADDLEIVNDDVTVIKGSEDSGSETLVPGTALGGKNRLVVVVQLVVTRTTH